MASLSVVLTLEDEGQGGGKWVVGESFPAVRGGVLPLAGSRGSSSVLSSSLAVLLRILAMFRAAKASKSLLLMVCRPGLKLSRSLPATSLEIWRPGGVRGGLPLDDQGGGGLLGRARSGPRCPWITRALSADLFGSLLSSGLSSGSSLSKLDSQV